MLHNRITEDFPVCEFQIAFSKVYFQEQLPQWKCNPAVCMWGRLLACNHWPVCCCFVCPFVLVGQASTPVKLWHTTALFWDFPPDLWGSDGSQRCHRCFSASWLRGTFRQSNLEASSWEPVWPRLNRRTLHRGTVTTTCDVQYVMKLCLSASLCPGLLSSE